MKRFTILPILMLTLWSGCSKSGGGVKLHTDTDSVAYVIGLNVGANLLKMDSTLNAARNLALESIERMQLFDIFLIEQNFDDRIDRDEQLTDVCNDIELAPNLTDEELTEAQLMHQVLYAYLKAKYRK